ncbi:MAG: type II toxin-antitoxin system RelE/ParE family toxin [Desulfobacteraceae bacterium]|nr:type II toxin-antitoxin system RelE/ParE family toxin [Desulfobacteraceae bacterium]
MPADICEKIVKRIDALGNNPRPVHSKKLKGRKEEYRLRIADYRVLYSIDDKKKVVLISHVKHRREIYR